MVTSSLARLKVRLRGNCSRTVGNYRYTLPCSLLELVQYLVQVPATGDRCRTYEKHDDVFGMSVTCDRWYSIGSMRGKCLAYNLRSYRCIYTLYNFFFEKKVQILNTYIYILIKFY